MSRYVKFLVAAAMTVAIALTFAAAQSPRVSAQTDNKALAQAWIDALNAGFKADDTSVVLALYDSSYTDPNIPAGVKAQDYMKAVLDSQFKAIPDGKFTVKYMLAEGDKVAIYSTFAGTNTGSLGGLDATGKAIKDVKSIDILTFNSAGKITADDNVTDQVSLFSQLGFTITPPKPAAAATAAK